LDGSADGLLGRGLAATFRQCFLIHRTRPGNRDRPGNREQYLVTAQVADLTGGETRVRSTDAVTLLTIYTFLLMVIPSPLVFSPLGGSGGPDTIFAALLLVAYLVTLAAPQLALSRGRQPIRVAAVVLTCAVLCAYVAANRRTLPYLEQNGADRGLILILGWLGIMLVAADGIPSMERLKTLLGRIILGASAMSVLAITQFFTGLNAAQYIKIPGLNAQTVFSDLLTRNQLNRPSATAIDPIELACVLAICLPIAIHRARFAPPGLARRRWLQAALIGIALPMTVSRTGIIAIAVASLVVLPTWPKRDRRMAYLVGLIAIAGMYASIPGLIGEFRSLFGQVGTDTSSTSRTSAFSSSVPFISQHPLFGRGFGTFLPATYFFTDDQYLLSFIEIGAVGLLALLGLFITGWLSARNARRLSTDPETRHLAQCMAAAVAVPPVAFATFDALSFAMAAGLTFLMLGCVGALWRLVRTEQSGAMGIPPGGTRGSRGPDPAPDFSDTDPIPVIRAPLARPSGVR
jgi:O-antigen ligase